MVKRNTWILIIVFVVLVMITMVIRNLDLGGNDDTATTVDFLYDVEASEIIRVEANNDEGAKIMVSRDDQGTWQLIVPENHFVDVSRIDSLAIQLARLRVFTTLQDPPSDEDMGLDSPNFQVVIGLADGSVDRFDVGHENAIGNGYYIRLDTGITMVISKTNLDALIGMIEDPPVLTPTATTGPTETQESFSLDDEDITLTPTP